MFVKVQKLYSTASFVQWDPISRADSSPFLFMLTPHMCELGQGELDMQKLLGNYAGQLLIAYTNYFLFVETMLQQFEFRMRLRRRAAMKFCGY